MYVFGIHDCATDNASMYVWPESIAHRGSNEVVCLYQYLLSLSGIDTLVFSDSCGGKTKIPLSSTIFILWGYSREFGMLSPSEATHFYHVTETLQRLGQKRELISCIHLNTGWMLVAQQ